MAIPHLLIHYRIESQNINHSMSSLNNLTTVYLTHPHNIFPRKTCPQKHVKIQPWKSRALTSDLSRCKDEGERSTFTGHLPKNCFDALTRSYWKMSTMDHGGRCKNKTNNISCFSCNRQCFTSPVFTKRLASLPNCRLSIAARSEHSALWQKLPGAVHPIVTQPQRQRCTNGTLCA